MRLAERIADFEVVLVGEWGKVVFPQDTVLWLESVRAATILKLLGVV